ncbi:MAG: cytidylate kinase-like family protein [Lachnospiraceae bacterium]|nr:cytidylate kinase-like family protein [Lachnospiraceae bacterium]
MEKQMIISIGREYGSGGHEIAERISKKYNLPIYDHNFLDELCQKKNLDKNLLAEFDEAKINKLFSRTVKGLNNSPAYNVANLQFEFLKDLAEEGKSFIVVGRCSEYVLRNYDALFSVFIYSNPKARAERLSKKLHITEKEATNMMYLKDAKRKKYHDAHSPIRWGKPKGYDLCIDSSSLGIDKTLDLLCSYIDIKYC